MNDKDKIDSLFDYFNRYAGTRYRARSKDGRLTENARMALALIDQGYTGKDFALVIRDRIRRWGNDPKMSQYIRPSTLFRQRNFTVYLGLAKAEMSCSASKKRLANETI